MKGNYTAYQKLTPITEDFGDNLMEQEDRMNKAQAVEDQKLEAKRKQDEEFAKSLGTDLSTLDDVITRVDSVDTAFALGVDGAREKMYEAYKQMKDDPNAATDVELQLKLANLRKFSSRLAGASENYTAFAKDFSEGYASGKYSKWNAGKMDEVSAIYEDNNFTVDSDERGNPIAVVKTEKGLKKVNLIESLNGKGLAGIVSTYDFDKGTTALASSLGERKFDSRNGYTTTTTQSFESHEKFVDDYTNGVLGSANKPSDVAKSIWADQMGRDPEDFNQEAFNEVKKEFKQAVKAKYDESSSQDFDSSRYNADAKRSSDRTKNANTMELKTKTDGDPLVHMGKHKGAAYQFSLGKPVDYGVGDKTLKISDVFYSKNGEISIAGQKKIPSKKASTLEEALGLEGGSAETYEPYTTSDIGEINTLARRVYNPNTGKNYTDAQEMAQSLSEQLPQQGGTQSSTSTNNESKDPMGIL